MASSTQSAVWSLVASMSPRAVGVARAALQDALRYAEQRKTCGVPICEHQSSQIKLADMATRVEVARLLVEQAASRYDRGEHCDMEAGMAKLFAALVKRYLA